RAVDIGGLFVGTTAGLVDGTHVGRGELGEPAVSDGGDDPAPDRRGCGVVRLRGEVSHAHGEVLLRPALDGLAGRRADLAALAGELGVAELPLDDRLGLAGEDDALGCALGGPPVPDGSDPAAVALALVDAAGLVVPSRHARLRRV